MDEKIIIKEEVKLSADFTPSKIKHSDILSDIEASPLVHKGSAYLNPEFQFKEDKSQHLFMGTGLVSTKGLSVGLPFDFFIYLITAVQLRTKLGLGKIIHLIADTHALGTQSADGFEDKVSSLAQEQMN